MLRRPPRSTRTANPFPYTTLCRSRTAELRRVVLALVRKAALYPRVQLIFACRSFDLENDHGYREIAATQGNVRVDVGPFARTEIDPVLARLGIFQDRKSTRLNSSTNSHLVCRLLLEN